MSIIDSSAQPKAPGRLNLLFLTEIAHHPRVSKGVFLAGIDESGGPVGGIINVLRTGRKVSGSGNIKNKPGIPRNMRNLSTPRV